MSADPLDHLARVAAERAAAGAPEAAMWVAAAAALREIRDGVIAGGRPILTVEEACALANVGSRAAFHRWTAAWRVKASGHGRYPRRAVLAGLEREASAVIPRRRTPASKPALFPAEDIAA